jgi:hypothetical protein
MVKMYGGYFNYSQLPKYYKLWKQPTPNRLAEIQVYYSTKYSKEN